MSMSNLWVILSSVTLSAIAQVSFKYGVSTITHMHDDSTIVRAFHLLTSPFVLIGLALYGVGTVLWLFALKNTELSLAYPFVGISFIMVLFIGVGLLGETVSVNKIAGTLIIVAGLFLLTR
ncbi:EamA family transporter [Porticoccus sp. W117]|uniref:EamA family transporter n=1 Tax=Porticoccus sp. W117 TaxID=3054777 RepID=UPI00259A8A00|nr:EamA family transporter [Porticoccus sp. W117]MDM3870629.1 EamA family transporter [Porticoccus sp. W117]